MQLIEAQTSKSLQTGKFLCVLLVDIQSSLDDVEASTDMV